MKEENVEGGRINKQRERTETIIGWAVIAFLVAIMFIRVFIAIWTVNDRSRTWSYRTAPEIPAEAYSSTLPSAATTEHAPPQVALPPPTIGQKAERATRAKPTKGRALTPRESAPAGG